MGKKAKRSRILSSVHETAKGLHSLGLIDRRRMQEYDALCLQPIKTYSTERIRALRKRLNLSQAVLAAVLNTSVSTVQKWEIGEKRPSGPSLKLLDVIDGKGIEALV